MKRISAKFLALLIAVIIIAAVIPLSASAATGWIYDGTSRPVQQGDIIPVNTYISNTTYSNKEIVFYLSGGQWQTTKGKFHSALHEIEVIAVSPQLKVEFVYEIKFITNGGTLSSNKTYKVNSGHPYGELPTATKAGYKFSGWKLDDTVITSTTKAPATYWSYFELEAVWTKDGSASTPATSTPTTSTPVASKPTASTPAASTPAASTPGTAVSSKPSASTGTTSEITSEPGTEPTGEDSDTPAGDESKSTGSKSNSDNIIKIMLIAMGAFVAASIIAIVILLIVKNKKKK